MRPSRCMKASTSGTAGNAVHAIGEVGRVAHQLAPAVTGDVDAVVRQRLGGPQRLDDRRIQHGRLQHRLAERATVAQRAWRSRAAICPRACAPGSRRWRECRWRPAARWHRRHASCRPQGQMRMRGDDADAGGGEVDAAGGHDAGQRRGLAAAPGDLADITGGLPAAHQVLHARRRRKTSHCRRPPNRHGWKSARRPRSRGHSPPWRWCPGRWCRSGCGR